MMTARTRGCWIALAVLGVCVLLSADVATAGGKGWHTSVEKATAESKSTGKPILVDFTGSDWCKWCWALRDEVFDTDLFKKWAKDNVVLLELDFPQRKQQSDGLRKQNATMKSKYNPAGFPTILFINAKGKELGRTGYVSGGAQAWIDVANKIINREVKPHKELVAAMAVAKKTKRPLLIVLHANPGTDAVKLAKGLFKDPTMIDFVEKYIEVAYVHLPKAAGPETAERKAVTALVKAHEITGAGLHMVFVDQTGEKLLHRNSTAEPPDGEKLVAELTKAMPPIAYNGEWLTDYPKAQLIAQQKSRPMLLLVTGNDRGGRSAKFDADVLASEAFKTYAGEKLVLVRMDFSRGRQTDRKLLEQNLPLVRKYRVRVVPTVVITDAAGKRLAMLGYEADPAALVKKLKSAVEK